MKIFKNFFIIQYIKNILSLSYFRFGLLVSITYVVEIFIFIYLILKIEIFWANFLASIIGISLDYFISTSKKFVIFNVRDSKKFLFYIFYIVFIFHLITFNSFLIAHINEIIDKPLISKLVVIPLSYTINWCFFYFLLSQKLKITNLK